MDKPRPYILSETNWKTVKSTNYDLAVLPWGATEAHNYHLPYATDNIQNEYILEQAAGMAWANGAKVIVLPNVPFGVNTGQLDVKLDLNINPSTQFSIMKDIAGVLDRQGIKKLLIFNGHGGNDFKQQIRELGPIFSSMFICTCHWYKSVDWDPYFTTMGDHAGEMETSVMMHIAPDLVLSLDVAGDGYAKKFKVDDLNENWAWAERQWTKVTEDTGIGDPKNATADRGKQYLEAVKHKISEFLADLCQSDPEDLYR